MSSITIIRETGRTVTITKAGRVPIAITKPVRTVSVTKSGARGPRGPAGDISQDVGDIAAIFLSA